MSQHLLEYQLEIRLEYLKNIRLLFSPSEYQSMIIHLYNIQIEGQYVCDL